MRSNYFIISVFAILLIYLVFQALDNFNLEQILKGNNIQSPTVATKLNNSHDSSARVINPIVITPL